MRLYERDDVTLIIEPNGAMVCAAPISCSISSFAARPVLSYQCDFLKKAQAIGLGAVSVHTMISMKAGFASS
jgi:hypothetical protein